MRQELIRRNYASTTIRSYLKAVEHFQQYIATPLEAVGPDDIRSHHAYLLGEKEACRQYRCSERVCSSLPVYQGA
jgi:hypothetical protein